MSRLLNDGEFGELRDYLRGTAGLEFDDSRRTGLSHVMAERLAATGVADIAGYVRLLDSPLGAAERQLLLDGVTIQETHFHRARPQIDALRKRILPDVLKRAAREGRRATIWSAGCATGEEAYTLAMLALEAAERMSSPPPVRVVGTDVSSAALEIAREARYHGRTVDLAEPGAVTRWLEPASKGRYVVRDEVRGLVEFAHHNLVTEAAPFAPGVVDLILCRNVTIYFSRETTKGLVERFRDALVREGWLLMGPAETLWQLTDAFSLLQVDEAFAYRPVPASLKRASRPARATVPLRPIGAAGVPGVTDHAHAIPAPAPRAPLRTVATRQRPASRPQSAQPLPVLDGHALLARARVALEAAEYDTAARLAHEAVLYDPLLTEAYVVCGQARATLGRDAEALEPLGRAVYLDQRAGHAWFLLASSLARTGDRTAAARAYRAAAESLPHAPRDAVKGLLDGAPVDQLVQLCRRLADDLGGEDDMRRGA